MSLQVLIATMNSKDHSLLDKMNIQSQAIVADQCDRFNFEEFDHSGHRIQWFSFNERGVGLNRNNALMRSDSEFCVIADDDMKYVDGYAALVVNTFAENPNVDLLIFNLEDKVNNRYKIDRKFKVKFRNFMRFGAARIAFRRKSVTKHGISFNLHFGGGAEYCAGEDTLFLYDCLKHGLNIMAIPEKIATLIYDRESTWFAGYNDDYFRDKGALFAAMSEKLSKILCLQFVIRKRKLFSNYKTWTEAYRLMLNGVNEYARLK